MYSIFFFLYFNLSRDTGFACSDAPQKCYCILLTLLDDIVGPFT